MSEVWGHGEVYNLYLGTRWWTSLTPNDMFLRRLPLENHSGLFAEPKVLSGRVIKAVLCLLSL